MRWLQELGRLGILLACGLLGACMVRLAPGFAIDGREFDTRLSAESLAKGPEPSHRSLCQFARGCRALVRPTPDSVGEVS